MPRPKGSRQVLDVRNRALDAALDLYSAEGRSGLQMRRIAAELGCAVGTLYQHFAGKAELERALVSYAFQRFLARVMPVAMDAAPGRARLQAVARAYVDFARQYPREFRLVFLAPIEVDPTLPPDPQPAGDTDTAMQMGAAVAHECLAEQGVTPPPDRMLVLAQTLWAGLHGVAALVATLDHDPDIVWAPLDARIDAMVEVLYRGLPAAV
ncbi:TetR/AcrR family transcriptional regulator [Niveibacterium umoris]|uniref:AcrR family transcriptional regulator n=1 Tax=Niveibacterium umoris TaxID=1193620 RepID=A0A840BRZ7_9RHOO|nr:TetR/AcrR family transcriptional regulator [Niveibacterium umoris]MBB4013596.1 AcrR family transcriptional regulator [Niveibacterium umoris]